MSEYLTNRRNLVHGMAALTLTGNLTTQMAFAHQGELSHSKVIDSDQAEITVLERLLGHRAREFETKIDSSANDGLPWYEVTARQGRVYLNGSSPLALTRGAYAYLRSIGAAQVNWEGNRIALPDVFPDYESGPIASPFAHRAYFNPCTYGYTMPFWDWARWEREIDWMALHGIDMPLALEGQEYVWRILWREQGLSREEIASYISGPAFLPWHRMGNIEGYATPVPDSYFDKKCDLQKKILKKMRALGMKPILPAFAGYVPKAYATRNPNLPIKRMEPWGGFHESYWLDPTDAAFSPLAKRFLELYSETYGEGEFYLADSFNEMRPPIAETVLQADKRAGNAVGKNEQLSIYGRAIYDSIQLARPGATWVMQGWLFEFDQEFWQPDSVAAYLGDVPDDQLMVLDIGNDYTRETWVRDKAFFGKSWIFGYIHNFGGNNPMFGDLELYRKDLTQIPKDERRGNLKGFGLFPEGLNTNSIVYEYTLDLVWGDQSNSVEAWLQTYLQARYGKTSAALLAAWSELVQSVYTTRNWGGAWWRGSFGTYVYFKRPNIELAGYDGPSPDRVGLKSAISQFLDLSDQFAHSLLFKHDVVAAVTHLVSLELDQTVIRAIKAYQAQDLLTGDRLVSVLRELSLNVDSLLGVQDQCLASWIDEAQRYGDTPKERAYYIENAKTQISVWGGDNVLKDYASKAWHGMYKHFYLPRWEMFFTALRQSVTEHKSFPQYSVSADLEHWEWAWAKDSRTYSRSVPKAPYNLIRALLRIIG